MSPRTNHRKNIILNGSGFSEVEQQLLKFSGMNTQLPTLANMLMKDPSGAALKTNRNPSQEAANSTQNPNEKGGRVLSASDNNEANASFKHTAGHSGRQTKPKFNETLQQKIGPVTSDETDKSENKPKKNSGDLKTAVLNHILAASFGNPETPFVKNPEVRGNLFPAAAKKTAGGAKPAALPINTHTAAKKGDSGLISSPGTADPKRYAAINTEPGMSAEKKYAKQTITTVGDTKTPLPAQSKPDFTQKQTSAENPKTAADSNFPTIADKKSPQTARTPSQPLTGESAVPERPAHRGEVLSRGTDQPSQTSPAAPVILAGQEMSTQPEPEATFQTQKVVSPPEILAAQSAIHKMNLSAERMKQFQTEKPQIPVANETVDPESGPKESVSDSIALPNGTEVSNTSSPAATSGLRENLGIGPGRQVQEAITTFYRPGTRQIIIRLDPPELGGLTIKFIEHKDGGITGILHAEKSHTRDQIQQALPEIVQNLHNCDIQVRKLDVVLSNPQQPSTAGEHSQEQHGAFEQHRPPESTASEATSFDSWNKNQENTDTLTESRYQRSDDSINMLI